jgi:hypothetical protein
MWIDRGVVGLIRDGAAEGRSSSSRQQIEINDISAIVRAIEALLCAFPVA